MKVGLAIVLAVVIGGVVTWLWTRRHDVPDV